MVLMIKGLLVLCSNMTYCVASIIMVTYLHIENFGFGNEINVVFLENDVIFYISDHDFVKSNSYLYHNKY